MAYNIQMTVDGEQGATVEQFISSTKKALQNLNQSWAKVKASLPADQQSAAEERVREILKA
jgi:hypothetical protein